MRCVDSVGKSKVCTGNITRLEVLDEEALKIFQAEECTVRAANVKSGWHMAKVQTLAARVHGPWPIVYGADGRQIVTINGHPISESHLWRRLPFCKGKTPPTEKVRCVFIRYFDSNQVRFPEKCGPSCIVCSSGPATVLSQADGDDNVQHPGYLAC